MDGIIKNESHGNKKVHQVFQGGRFAGNLFLAALMLLAEEMMVRCAGGFGILAKAMGGTKLAILGLLNLMLLLLFFRGNYFCRWMSEKARGLLRVLDWLMLSLTPAFFFLLVQMIVGDSPVSEREYWGKNLLVYYWIFFLFLILVRKAFLACELYGLFWVVLALVEYYVLLFRGQAFTLPDIMAAETALDVAGGYHFDMPPMLCALLLLFLLYAQIQRDFQQLEFGKWNLKNVGIRLGLLGLMGVCTFAGRSFYLDSEDVDLWDINLEYRQKGYAYSLAREIRYLSVEKPEGYSSEKASEIAKSYENDGKNALEEAAADSQSTVSAPSVVPENIILIMNESLTDFSSVGDLEAEEDVLEKFHALSKSENVKSGTLYVPAFGGGTCQTEYEVLTGNYVGFLPMGSFAYQLYTQSPEHGLAESVKSQGYTAVAVHPNEASKWNRSNVYTHMGFDAFISTENWGYECDKLRWYASDKGVYDKITEICETKTPGEKLFVFGVTMQNHGSYGEENMADFVPDVTLGYQEEYPLAETFLSLEKESDQAFADLISYFEDTEEPTMVIMFGDHWPQLEEGFFSQILGQDLNSLEQDLTALQQMYTTPYLIWTNYSSQESQEDMSANYFGAYVASAAGLQLTPYQEFLLEMKEKIPVYGMGALRTADGSWESLEEPGETTARWLSDYQLLQYNNLFDRKNRAEDFFTVSEE